MAGSIDDLANDAVDTPVLQIGAKAYPALERHHAEILEIPRLISKRLTWKTVAFNAQSQAQRGFAPRPEVT